MDSQEDRDIETIRPTLLAKVAGAALIGVGAFTLLLGAQTYMVVRLTPMTLTILALLVLSGGAALGFGTKVVRMYGWAAVGGTVAAGLTAVVGASWFLLALLNGMFSPLAFFVPAGATVAAVLSGVTIPPGRKADAARERLRDAGLEAGA
jgi:hypothetical protein